MLTCTFPSYVFLFVGLISVAFNLFLISLKSATMCDLDRSILTLPKMQFVSGFLTNDVSGKVVHGSQFHDVLSRSLTSQ